MAIRARQIILIHDDTVRPPKPKFVVCVEPENGWFYRINSRPHWRPAVGLPRGSANGFPDHDSFVECGDPLEIDDYIVDESLERAGVVGTLPYDIVLEIIRALDAAVTLKAIDKKLIIAALNAEP